MPGGAGDAGGEVLVPVGHLVGRFARATEDQAHPTAVRVGSDHHWLSDGEAATWLFAHSAGAGPRWPWTFPRIVQAARNTPDFPVPSTVDTHLERLVERGLVRPVPSDDAGVAAFARAHRLVPLALGLGNTPREPGVIRVGGAGLPLFGASPDQHLVWWWSPVHTSLWNVCAAEADGGDPVAVVRRFLPLLQGYLATGTAHLDLAGYAPPVGAGTGRLVGPPPPVPDPPPPPPASPIPGLPGLAPVGYPGAPAWVFPVGHYGGALHDPATGRGAVHLVRVGRHEHTLADPDEFLVWSLAHGRPGGLGSAPWTRRDIRSVAADAPLADPDAVLDGLLDRGLVVEVRPGTDQAVEFTAAHRVHYLYSGLGTHPTHEYLYEIGLPGQQPLAQVGDVEALLWRTGWADASLRVSCRRLAAERGAPDPADTDTAARVDDALVALRVLLAEGVAYLDVTR